MALRARSLSWTVLAAGGALCATVLSYLFGEVIGDFIGGWVTEEIGARTGIEEARVKTIIAGWLLPVAVVPAAMWLAAIVTRWRSALNGQPEPAPRLLASSPWIEPRAAWTRRARRSLSRSTTKRRWRFISTARRRTARRSLSGPWSRSAPHGTLTHVGHRWMAKDADGRELRHYVATAGADRTVIIESAY